MTIFTSDYEWMINGYPCKITFDNISYPSVEHAFQASKTDSVEDKQRIAYAASVQKALEIGREVPLSDSWGKKRLAIMETLLRLKYTSSKELQQKLCETGDEPIIANMRNTFWGSGYDADGDNWLGKLHEKIRSELQTASIKTETLSSIIKSKLGNKNQENVSKVEKTIAPEHVYQSLGITNSTSLPELKQEDSVLTVEDKEEFDSWLK